MTATDAKGRVSDAGYQAGLRGNRPRPPARGADGVSRSELEELYNAAYEEGVADRLAADAKAEREGAAGTPAKGRSGSPRKPRKGAAPRQRPRRPAGAQGRSAPARKPVQRRRAARRAPRPVRRAAAQVAQPISDQTTSALRTFGMSLLVVALYLVLTNAGAFEGALGGLARGLEWLQRPDRSIAYSPNFGK